MPLTGLTNLILPCFLITLTLIALAWLVDRRSQFYRAHVDEEIAATRFHSIDGLRGFLAIFVLFHHSVINYFYYSSGQWTVPPSRVATLFGQGGVAMFFMVTALLFWHRALVSKGKLDLGRFFLSRIMRTVPMYVVSASTLVITALALTHFRLNVPPSQIFKDTSAWLLFTFLGTPNVNGLPNTVLINTVFWSLVYEWRFYFVFPLLLFFSRGAASWVLLACCALLVHWYSVNNVEWYFVYGALAAMILYAVPSVRKVLVGRIGSIAVLACLGAIYKTTPTAYSASAAPLFFAVFLVLASGNTMFGVLTSRPARVLGAVSYSIYLLHNFFLYLLFRWINHFTDVIALSLFKYWTMTALVGFVTVGVSLLTYRYIEYPFLKPPRPAWLSDVAAAVHAQPADR